MKLSGSLQKKCTAGWLLAALFIGGFNVHHFMMMESQPMVGYSQTIKTLQGNLQQFDQILAEGLFSLASRVELPDSDTPAPVTGQAVIDIPVVVDPDAPSEPIILPSLTGIVHVVRTDGSVYYQALINGRLCQAKDKIDGFTVDRISSKRVVVRRSGLKWTIERPTPYYSSDQGS